MVDLKKQVVVVTGGSGLIGSFLVKAIVKNNGIAVIADTNIEKSNQLANKLESEFSSDKVLAIGLDITSKASIVTMIKEVRGKYGRIDAVINNAYPRNENYGRSFYDVEYSDFCDNVGSHLGGYFLFSQQIGLYFKKQGKGNIVNMASIYGVIPPRFEVYDGTSMTVPVEYAAIKSAIVHLTKYMAKFFKGMSIRVNAISPGGILDNQPESFLIKYNKLCLNKGMLELNDLEGTILFLLSDASKYINGQNIIVDDGYCL